MRVLTLSTLYPNAAQPQLGLFVERQTQGLAAVADVELVAGRGLPVWPLSRHPDLLPRGHRFFERWGFAGVFVGRFFGPLRASIPLVAGICSMPFIRFQLANVLSAVVWAAGVLAPGAFGLNWLRGWL